MRRIRYGSASQSATRVVRSVLPSVLSVAALVWLPSLAVADPGTDAMATLIANVAKANQRLMT